MKRYIVSALSCAEQEGKRGWGVGGGGGGGVARSGAREKKQVAYKLQDWPKNKCTQQGPQTGGGAIL